MRGTIDHDPRSYDPLKNVARDEALKQSKTKRGVTSTPTLLAVKDETVGN